MIQLFLLLYRTVYKKAIAKIKMQKLDIIINNDYNYYMEKNKNKNIFTTFLKGLAMGSVDIVPGISGGTMAMILNIYTRIIDEIRSINLELLKNLIRFKFKKVLEIIDWKFLSSLLLGIITAIIGLAHAISFVLEHHPTYLYSFFFGLIIISALMLIPRKKIISRKIILLLIGVATAWIISSFSPAKTPENYLFVFISGAIAVCAMILPGISGSFMLLLLGKYEFIISLIKNPLNESNPLFIVFFIFGGLLGLISFAKLLGYLVKKHYESTLITLIGFMLGSLNKIWPFKEVLSSQTKGVHTTIIKQKNILPQINQEFAISLSIMILGIAIGLCLFKLNKKQKN